MFLTVVYVAVVVVVEDMDQRDVFSSGNFEEEQNTLNVPGGVLACLM
tara:strand:+ start:929 stop:1069 length:141 start_codon:yes stop_codon:yes gene_type:complete